MKKDKTTKKLGLPRILIVGCGDIGMRILPLLQAKSHRQSTARFRIYATTSQIGRCRELREAGAIPLVVDLDKPASLARLANLATLILYLAPPAAQGEIDSRSRHLAALLNQQSRLVYVSTSGVYGDCAGAWIDETQVVQPKNARAIRRVDAEQVWRQWARRTASVMSILRVPGIYAAERLPVDRLKNGTPALLPEEDVYTNHIHADDLAHIVVQALFQGRTNRIYHTVDDSCMLMGDYFDLVAATFALEKVPRLPSAELKRMVSPMLMSFMTESRRMHNTRMKQELGIRLRYPTVQDGLKASKALLAMKVNP